MRWQKFKRFAGAWIRLSESSTVIGEHANRQNFVNKFDSIAWYDPPTLQPSARAKPQRKQYYMSDNTPKRCKKLTGENIMSFDSRTRIFLLVSYQHNMLHLHSTMTVAIMMRWLKKTFNGWKKCFSCKSSYGWFIHKTIVAHQNINGKYRKIYSCGRYSQWVAGMNLPAPVL